MEILICVSYRRSQPVYEMYWHRLATILKAKVSIIEIPCF